MTGLLNPETFFHQLPDLDEAALLEFIESWQDFKAHEIKSFLDYILNRAPALDLEMDLYDCCGTGGDAANTFNISTATAIVAAATGVKVCKNGGRSTTSKTGSVDVLEALGLNLGASLEKKINGLKQYNLAFYSSQVSAELLAPVKQICRKHKQTSFLSLIGPLASPVKLSGQVIGVGQEAWISPLVDLLRQLIDEGRRDRALLVHSVTADKQKLDELSSASTSLVIELAPNHKQEYEFDPQDIDIAPATLNELTGADPDSNASIILSCLAKPEHHQAKTDTLCLNSAALNLLAKANPSSSQDEFINVMRQYFDKSQEVLISGQANSNWFEFKDSQNT